MSISYTVKQGDTLNGIASSYGYKDYKEAGVGSVKSGNFDLVRAGGASSTSATLSYIGKNNYFV